MSLKTELEEELYSELGALAEMQVGGEEYESAVKGISILAERLQKMEDSEKDRILKQESHDDEMMMREKELKQERNHKIIGHAIDVGKFIAGSALTFGVAIMTMNFEREGTFTTKAGQSTIKELLKFKWK